MKSKKKIEQAGFNFAIEKPKPVAEVPFQPKQSALLIPKPSKKVIVPTGFDAPRWPGGPLICKTANLPFFNTLAELEAFVNKLCATTDANWECHACKGFHFWSHGGSQHDSAPRSHDGPPARIRELIEQRIKPDGMTMLKNAVK